MAGDPHWNSVVLAMHTDGANASTVFTDVKGKAVTAVGNAQISTAQSKFGGASAKFDGSGDYLNLPNTTDFDFPGAFTIDGWVYMSAYGASWMAMLSRYYDSTPAGYRIILNQSAGGLWQLSFVSSDGVVRGVNGGALVTGTWYHIEVGYDGTTYYAFTNGVLNNTLVAPAPKAVGTSMAPLIGATNSSAWFLNGYVDDLRITKGVCRNTANFTPPAAAFLEYAGQITGTVRDDAGALCARTVRAYLRSSGALVGSTTSDAGTGAYSINTQTLAEHTGIALDDVAGTQYNALVLDKLTPA